MRFCLRSGSLERQLFYIGLAFLPVAVLLFWLHQYLVLPILPFRGCIFDKLFHLYCPGCGGTRALDALLKGEFLKSFQYHPLVLYSAIVYIIFMVSQLLEIISRGRIKGIRFHAWYLYVALIILVGNCLVRNYLRIRHGIIL